MTQSAWASSDEHLIHFATETGALLLEGMGDGIGLSVSSSVAVLSQQNNALYFYTAKSAQRFLF